MATLQERNEALIKAREPMRALLNICDHPECRHCRARREALNNFQTAAIQYGKGSTGGAR